MRARQTVPNPRNSSHPLLRSNSATLTLAPSLLPSENNHVPIRPLRRQDNNTLELRDEALEIEIYVDLVLPLYIFDQLHLELIL